MTEISTLKIRMEYNIYEILDLEQNNSCAIEIKRRKVKTKVQHRVSN